MKVSFVFMNEWKRLAGGPPLLHKSNSKSKLFFFDLLRCSLGGGPFHFVHSIRWALIDWFHSFHSFNHQSTNAPFILFIHFSMLSASFVWFHCFSFLSSFASLGRSHWRCSAHNPPQLKKTKKSNSINKYRSSTNQLHQLLQKEKAIDWIVDLWLGCLLSAGTAALPSPDCSLGAPLLREEKSKSIFSSH